MSTKPAAKVQESPTGSMEKIAYASVSSIPTIEPNDQNRLGYHIWRWLLKKEGSIENAVKESGSRLKITTSEAAKIITESLKKQGIIQ
ncbi:MAG: hypothetical protein ACHQQQ_06185 [Bacteroidota bacterium]